MVLTKNLTNLLQEEVRDYIDKNCDIVYVVEPSTNIYTVETLLESSKVFYFGKDGFIYDLYDFKLEELKDSGFFNDEVENDFYLSCYYVRFKDICELVKMLKEYKEYVEKDLDKVLNDVFKDMTLPVIDLILLDDGFDYYIIDIYNLKDFLRAYYFILDC